MEILEAIRGRRAIRRYGTDAVSPEVIAELVRCANLAPYANPHPWECIVVQDQMVLKKVQQVCPGLFGSPPVVIVLCVNLEQAEVSSGRVGKDFYSIADPSFAAQNLMLAAYEFGLGSCPIVSFPRESIRMLLEIPKNVEPIYLISLGYPRITPKTPPRPPLVERVFIDGYGHRFFEGKET